VKERKKREENTEKVWSDFKKTEHYIFVLYEDVAIAG
jgi:hypothetical protein